MNPALLDAILEKANLELDIVRVGLFNWTEPLLHPDLPAMVRTVRARGNRVELSSNLNRLPDPEALMAAAPDYFRVSVSGFEQATYRRAHRNGDIEVVKENMLRLAIARQESNAQTHLDVLFHRYSYNREDEASMRWFSEKLGYSFGACWAMYMPAEKILAMVGEDVRTITVTDEDRAVASTLSIEIQQALAVARADASQSCALLEQQLVLDVKGDVYLCCGSTTSPFNRIGSYLHLSLAEIQAHKREKPLCGPCMKHGIHDYFVRQDRFEALARY